LTKAPDEKSRAFERVLASLLLLKTITIRTTKIDGSDERFQDLTCSFIKPLGPFCPPKVELSTLFVPQDHTFPLADFIIASQSQVIILQVTFQQPKNKLPNNTNQNIYTAIYNPNKYTSVLQNNNRLNLPPGQTFGESLLQPTKYPTRVTVGQNNDL